VLIWRPPNGIDAEKCLLILTGERSHNAALAGSEITRVAAATALINLVFLDAAGFIVRCPFLTLTSLDQILREPILVVNLIW
jgi:hypothetical protein